MEKVLKWVSRCNHPDHYTRMLIWGNCWECGLGVKDNYENHDCHLSAEDGCETCEQHYKDNK